MYSWSIEGEINFWSIIEASEWKEDWESVSLRASEIECDLLLMSSICCLTRD